MNINTPKRISVSRELRVLLIQGYRALTGNKINLMISLFFPFMAVAIIVWIAGENMFVNMPSTKSGCFILVCAAIWGGLFNSIQTIVKERKIIRRDYVSGALRLECYTISRAVIQLVLCTFQSAVLTVTFFGVNWAYGNELPSEGLILSSPIVEYFITLLLIVYSADTMGLFISSIVKNEQLASQMSPYILIVQLLFSGVLFPMKGAASTVSGVMLSRWGMEALGSISRLCSLPSQVPIDADTQETFLASAEHLRNVWLYLLAFVLVPLILSNIALYGVKKDTKG